MRPALVSVLFVSRNFILLYPATLLPLTILDVYIALCNQKLLPVIQTDCLQHPLPYIAVVFSLGGIAPVHRIAVSAAEHIDLLDSVEQMFADAADRNVAATFLLWTEGALRTAYDNKLFLPHSILLYNFANEYPRQYLK